MSDSFERKVINKRIANLEEKVRKENLYMDSLYAKYSFRVDRVEIQDCVETIQRYYDELLILKGVIIDADYAASRMEVNT